MEAPENISKVCLEKQAEKAICTDVRIPSSVVEKVIKNEKGNLYLDTREELFIYQYMKTCIVTEVQDDVATVKNVFRSKRPFNDERFKKIN